jgi:hypothetical protein
LYIVERVVEEETEGETVLGRCTPKAVGGIGLRDSCELHQTKMIFGDGNQTEVSNMERTGENNRRQDETRIRSLRDSNRIRMDTRETTAVTAT